MKLLFLGSGSAFTLGADNYQASMLLMHDNGKNLLIDCGSDSRWSLYEQKLSHKDVHSIYVSHLHSDHVGGLEWIAFATKFDTCKKPILYISETMVEDVWDRVLSGGLRSIENENANIETFFKVHPVKGEGSFSWQGIKMKLVSTIHYKSDSKVMPTYGLFFSINGHKIHISADTQFTPEHLLKYYQDADTIFHDCETSTFSTGVHSSYRDLVTLPAEIKKKMWLYHYNPGPLPNAHKDGFKGFVKKGQIFEF